MDEEDQVVLVKVEVLPLVDLSLVEEEVVEFQYLELLVVQEEREHSNQSQVEEEAHVAQAFLVEVECFPLLVVVLEYLLQSLQSLHLHIVFPD